MKKIVVLLVNIFLCHLFYRVKYINLDKIKNLNQYVLCPNHSNILDPVWIYPKIKNLYIIAKSELFKNKVLGWFLRKFGAFPIKREQKDAKSIVHAIKILKNNKNSKLLLFPEGGILPDNLRRIKITDSATYIAAKTNLPIVPVYITENPKIFSKVIIVFGDKMHVNESLIKNKEELKAKSKELLKRIYNLNNIAKNGGVNN